MVPGNPGFWQTIAPPPELKARNAHKTVEHSVLQKVLSIQKDFFRHITSMFATLYPYISELAGASQIGASAGAQIVFRASLAISGGGWCYAALCSQDPLVGRI